MNPINYILWIVGIIIGLTFSPMTATPAQSVPSAPVYACDNIQAVKLDRTTFEFTTDATVMNGPKLVNYTFNFGDGKMATTSSKTVRHEYSQQGRYTVTATVNVQLDDGIKAASSKSCAVMVKVERPPVTTSEHCDPAE